MYKPVVGGRKARFLSLLALSCTDLLMAGAFNTNLAAIIYNFKIKVEQIAEINENMSRINLSHRELDSKREPNM